MSTDIMPDYDDIVFKAEIRAKEADLIRQKIAGNRDNRVKLATDVLLRNYKAGNTKLSQQEWDQFRATVRQAEVFSRQVDLLDKIEGEARAMSQVYVRAEPRVYEPDSPHSFFRDGAVAALASHPDQRHAEARLARHAKEVAVEAREGSPEGKRAIRQFSEALRMTEPTDRTRALRAMSSGATSGGSFTTPAYLEEAWAPYRSYQRSFADQCETSLDLPDYGMEVVVPAVTSGVATAQQTAENTGVVDLDPKATAITTPVVTVAGQITLSQQFFDRAGPIRADVLMRRQLGISLNASLDAYVITAALANAGTGVSAGTTIPELWGDVAKAANAVETTAGAQFPASHVFFQPINWRWYSSQVDAQGRPILTPNVVPGDAWPPNPAPGATGYDLSGIQVFTDGNIPTSGGNNQVIVCNPKTVVLLEGEPTLTFVPNGAGAPSMSVTCIMRQYCAAVVLSTYESAVQSITGYTPAPSFA